jgi:predicted ATPase
LLADIKGIGYLKRLLQHPGSEFHALDLFAGGAGTETAGDEVVAQLRERSDVSVRALGDAGAMLDEQAKLEYKRRLRELNAELEDLRERGSADRAATLESEIDFLTREVLRATGLGGRSRRSGSDAERARLSVSRAIRSAIQRISEHNRPLGEYLERSVRTGIFCSYLHDRRRPYRFAFSGEEDAAAGPSNPPGAPALILRASVAPRTLADRTTYVGRISELASLSQLLDRARSGEGSLAVVAGPAGAGKTRISAELATEACSRGFITLSGGCQDRDDSIPLLPFVEILEASLAQISDPGAFRAVLGDDGAEVTRLLPQLRSIYPDIPQPLALSPEQSERMLFRAIANILSRIAAQAPILILIEDLHWGDAHTFSLLDHLARSLQKAPVAIIGTYRDSEVQAAGPFANTLLDLDRVRLLTRVGLRALPRQDVAAMLRHMSGGREPPPQVVEFIYSGTEGNPLFVEELFRHLAERGELLDARGEFLTDFRDRAIEVPPNLRILLARRLGRLSDSARRVLAIAAVIGSAFTFELLQAASRTDEESVLDGVEQAERAALISSTIEQADPLFQFSHELIRQAVLADLSAPRRNRIHLDVAQAYERVNPAFLQVDARSVAHHLWHAGSTAPADKTVQYLTLAAKQAITRSDNLESIPYLTRALSLLPALPQSLERSQRELALRLSLGIAETSVKGSSAPEVGEQFGLAQKLCQELGDSPQVPIALLGLFAFYQVRADYDLALKLAEEALQHALRFNDRSIEMEAHLRLGVSKLYLGDIAQARIHFERSISLEMPELDVPHALAYGQNPAVAARVYLGLALAMMGYPDQALSVSEEGLARARKSDHALTLAFALYYAAWIRMERGEWTEFAADIEELRALSVARGFTLWGTLGSTIGSILLARKGEPDSALTIVGDGIAAYRAIGASCGEPLLLSFQSTLNLMFGNIDKAFALMFEARDLMRRHGEFVAESDLLRLEGQLLLSRRTLSAEDSIRAEQCLESAIEVASRRQAKLHELRAAILLARLWRDRGRVGDARKLIADIYGWFKEGFEIADLRRARKLLAELR